MSAPFISFDDLAAQTGLALEVFINAASRGVIEKTSVEGAPGTLIDDQLSAYLEHLEQTYGNVHQMPTSTPHLATVTEITPVPESDNHPLQTVASQMEKLITEMMDLYADITTLAEQES